MFAILPEIYCQICLVQGNSPTDVREAVQRSEKNAIIKYSFDHWEFNIYCKKLNISKSWHNALFPLFSCTRISRNLVVTGSQTDTLSHRNRNIRSTGFPDLPDHPNIPDLPDLTNDPHIQNIPVILNYPSPPDLWDIPNLANLPNLQKNSKISKSLLSLDSQKSPKTSKTLKTKKSGNKSVIMKSD